MSSSSSLFAQQVQMIEMNSNNQYVEQEWQD